MKSHIIVKSESEVPEWAARTGLSEEYLASEFVKAHMDGRLCIIAVDLTSLQYHELMRCRHISRPDFWEFTRA